MTKGYRWRWLAGRGWDGQSALRAALLRPSDVAVQLLLELLHLLDLALAACEGRDLTAKAAQVPDSLVIEKLDSSLGR